MNFCSQCGAPVTNRIPKGDNRERYVCIKCDAIHYENPRTVVGTLPVYDDKVLLCKRDIEPRLGYWTLPAGFLENGETCEQGALRETVEEACAEVRCDDVYRIYNVLHANQIHMFFRATMLTPEFQTTPESSEVALFEFDGIPWTELAFPTVHRALVDYRAQRKSGVFDVQMSDIDKSDWLNMVAPD